MDEGTINGQRIDGFAVIFQLRENSPAVGKWQAYPMTSNDGFGRTIIHDGHPMGSEVGYDTPREAAVALSVALYAEDALDHHLGG